MLIAAFGNRDYGKSLEQLCRIVSEKGFIPVGAAAFSSRHCMAPAINAARPCPTDLAETAGFAKRVGEKLSVRGARAMALTTADFPVKKSINREEDLIAYPRRRGRTSLGLLPGTGPQLVGSCTQCGRCAQACPTGAITFEEREAPAYDHAAVLAAKAARAADKPLPCGCPGSQSRAIRRPEAAPTAGDIPSELRQWPVQIKLAPVNAPYFDGCDLLIAADCTAYAYGAFHRDFIRGRVTLIGCPKLDEGDYSEKLTAILAQNDIRSVTVVRMAVPCCGGIQRAAERAVSASGKPLSLHTVIVGTDGTLLRQA